MKNSLLISLSLFAVLGIPLTGQSQCVYTSTASGGLFTSPTTWMVSGGGCGPIPSATSEVIINGPVVLNTDFTLTGNNGRITINSGGSLAEDSLRRTLTLGTGIGAQQLDRALVAAGANLNVSELIIEKSQLTVEGTATVQCNLSLDNQGIVTINGTMEVNGNLALVTGNPILQGNGTLLIRGCVTGSNGSLQQAIQGNLLVCVQNLPTQCGTGTCNGDVPVNNDANCLLILPPVLPVELTGFKADAGGGYVQLGWQTASERNAQEFRIERSANGREFGGIGHVWAMGTSTAAHSYTWRDERPLAGQSYYRLQQIDRDGTTAYSALVSVKADRQQAALTLWPAGAGIYEVGTLGAPTMLTVLTPQGRVVRAQAMPEVGGRLNLSAYPAGIYLIRATSSLGSTTTRVAHLGQ